MEKSEQKYTKPEEHKECLLTLFVKLHNLFKKHKIKYFIDGGSLLGANRDGGMIPHDDDIDLGVLDKDWGKCMNSLKELCDDKYKIYYSIDTYIIKVFVPNMWMKHIETGKIFGTPTIDIFKWTKSNNKIELASINHRRQFKNCYYNKDELYPLKIYSFNGIPAWGANNGLPYLYRYYGNDCMIVRKCEFRDPNNVLSKSLLREI